MIGARGDEETGEIAAILRLAVSLPDERAFDQPAMPRYTEVDYCRMACHLIFRCQRCGNCCTTGDPIRLRRQDVAILARHLKIPLQKALRKYTVPDHERPGLLAFKHVRPCKFYDPVERSCKIYPARPWSCRIFPFLGIYGSEDRVVVNESCPGSVAAMRALTEAMQVRSLPVADLAAVRSAKMALQKALEGV